MRTYSTTTITGAVLTTLLFAFSAFARDHSALNGTWTLVPAKSDFAGQPVVQTGTVTINDRQGIIIVSRSFVYEGATETFFYRDITDAENNATIHTGKDLKSKTRWDHDVLKVTTTQSGAITVESYTLAADGTMMVSVVQAGPQADHPRLPAQIEQCPEAKLVQLIIASGMRSMGEPLIPGFDSFARCPCSSSCLMVGRTCTRQLAVAWDDLPCVRIHSALASNLH